VSTPRETILAALHARLLALPATALRGDVLPKRVPTAGLLILLDGEPGETEVTLSPVRYQCQHRTEIGAVAQGASRDAAFDKLCASLRVALASNRTQADFAVNSMWKRQVRSIYCRLTPQPQVPAKRPVDATAAHRDSRNRLATPFLKHVVPGNEAETQAIFNHGEPPVCELRLADKRA
jgi:hypothetical protein